MFRRAQVEIPLDFRARLEAARLDLLALFRALDRMHLAPEQIPPMLRDTLAALEQLSAACSRFRKTLPSQAQPILSQLELTIRSNLGPMEANVGEQPSVSATMKLPHVSAPAAPLTPAD
jgi:hypothetical protein